MPQPSSPCSAGSTRRWGPDCTPALQRRPPTSPSRRGGREEDEAGAQSVPDEEEAPAEQAEFDAPFCYGQECAANKEKQSPAPLMLPVETGQSVVPLLPGPSAAYPPLARTGPGGRPAGQEAPADVKEARGLASSYSYTYETYYYYYYEDQAQEAVQSATLKAKKAEAPDSPRRPAPSVLRQQPKDAVQDDEGEAFGGMGPERAGSQRRGEKGGPVAASPSARSIAGRRPRGEGEDARAQQQQFPGGFVCRSARRDGAHQPLGRGGAEVAR